MKVEADFDTMVKVLIIGDYAVGKSNIIFRFIENRFNDNHMTTTGYDYQEKVLFIQRRTVKIQVWDTAGQERYRALSKNLFTKVQGIILIYDITDRRTFESVEDWMVSIRSINSKIPVLLVGNKCDMEEMRVVSQQEGFDLANKMKVKFLETSAKDNVNIETAFVDIAESLLKTNQVRSQSLSLTKESFSKKKHCCY